MTQGPVAARLADTAVKPGTWVRLVRQRRGDGELAPEGKWHLVHDWAPLESRLVLGCTRRRRDIGWALLGQGGYRFVRSTSVPTPESDACSACRRWM